MRSWKLKRYLKQAAAVVVVLALTVGLYFLLSVALRTVLQLDPTLATGIVAAVATIVVSVISILIAKRVEQRALIEKEQREKKSPAYEDLLEFIFRILHGEKLTGSSLSDTEIVSRVSEITRKLIIWGSDEVLGAFSVFMSTTRTNPAPFTVLICMERVLLAIRKDLGHQNRGLQGGQILRTFLTDLDKLVAEQRSNTSLERTREG
jgi:hypothetical protein